MSTQARHPGGDRRRGAGKGPSEALGFFEEIIRKNLVLESAALLGGLVLSAIPSRNPSEMRLADSGAAWVASGSQIKSREGEL